MGRLTDVSSRWGTIQSVVILGLCLTAASVYALGSGRARLTVVPARPTDRAFLVRSWGELRLVTELPALIIEPRPFLVEPYPAPEYGPEPAPWGAPADSLRWRGRPSRPPQTRALRVGRPPRPVADADSPGFEPARPVMARFPSVAPAPEPAPAASLPDGPDPAQVREVIASLRGRAERCYESTMVPGRVELLLTVEGASGAVGTARASGESPIARCIERAALALRFPLFARASISVQQTYTFR